MNKCFIEAATGIGKNGIVNCYFYRIEGENCIIYRLNNTSGDDLIANSFYNTTYRKILRKNRYSHLYRSSINLVSERCFKRI